MAIPQITRAVRAYAPPRLVLNAVEGWGKTTFGANLPKALMVMDPKESGYSTLLSAGLVPQIKTTSPANWQDTLDLVDYLTVADIGFDGGTLVFDAIGGFERLCHEYVCKTQFKNNWSDEGFMSYMKGYHISAREWVNLLLKLDILREKHRVSVVFLAHCQVKPFRNPIGADYDRFATNVHEKTWAATHQWADAVLFGTFQQAVIGGTATGNKDRKGKVTDGDRARVIHTERSDAFDAKNRYGLPSSFIVSDNHTGGWQDIWNPIMASLAGASELPTEHTVITPHPTCAPEVSREIGQLIYTLQIPADAVTRKLSSLHAETPAELTPEDAAVVLAELKAHASAAGIATLANGREAVEKAILNASAEPTT